MREKIINTVMPNNSRSKEFHRVMPNEHRRCECLGIFLISAISLIACIPQHLSERFQKQNNSSGKNALSTVDTLGKEKKSPQTANSSQVTITPESNIATSNRGKTFFVDDKTFRFPSMYEEVWDSTLTALMRNYNLTIVDKDSGIITTEWDTYFLKGQVYRNKVSVRLKRVYRALTELTVHNNVEKLQDSGSLSKNSGTLLWLPSEEGKSETFRIVHNLSTLLQVDPPQQITEAISKGIPQSEGVSNN